MWFKRRKKIEQHQALSQSLRSLQSLLNDSGRREPSLDTQYAESGAGESDQTGEPSVEPRQPTAPPRQTEERERGPLLKEPSPSDSASRWRDLSLSFDAEPVVTVRSRPDPEDHGEHPETEPGDKPLEDDPEQTAAARAEEHNPPELAFDDTSDGGELDTPEKSAGDEDDIEALTGEAPGHDHNFEPAVPGDEYADGGGDDAEARESDGAADGPDDVAELDKDLAAINDEDTEMEPTPITNDTIVDFEAFFRPPGGPSAGDEAPVDEEVDIEARETAADVSIHDPEPAAGDDSNDLEWVGRAAHEGQVDARAGGEDQLHLELEPANEASEDAIPTLTEAVYVPDGSPVEPPAGDEAAAEPPEAELPAEEETTIDEAVADAPIKRVIERLRTRLQILELDELSPGQEAQLRDALEELMDELRDGTTGH